MWGIVKLIAARGSFQFHVSYLAAIGSTLLKLDFFTTKGNKINAIKMHLPLLPPPNEKKVD